MRHRILVTGASRGIGAATAVAFARLGSCAVALVARGRDGLERTADACRAAGAEAHVIECDVTRSDDVGAMARAAIGHIGPPTAIVNNAGSFEPGGVLAMEARAFEAQLASNLTSAFLVTRAFLPTLLARGSGHVFFMGSTASIRGYPSGVAYCAAKHGLLGLARALREETLTAGLRVTTLLPGATLTASWAGTDLPEDRFMPAEDVAAAIVAAYSMDPRTDVEEILLRPRLGDV